MIGWLKNLFKRKEPQFEVIRPEGSVGEWGFRVTRAADSAAAARASAISDVIALIAKNEREGLRTSPDAKGIYVDDKVQITVTVSEQPVQPSFVQMAEEFKAAVTAAEAEAAREAASKAATANVIETLQPVNAIYEAKNVMPKPRKKRKGSGGTK